MTVTLATHRNRPAISIADHKGECWLYLYAVTVTPATWSVRLTAVDPETGETACDRQGRERSYTATFSELGEFCQCPDFTCRRLATGTRCKHLETAAELRPLLAAMQGVSP